MSEAGRTVIIHPGPQRRLLRGAAAMAKALGCSRQTVYRCKEMGAPIWKMHGRGSPLLACRDELRAWRDRNRPAPREADE